MFGISFTEILLILAVALVVVGPQKLPQMLGTIGAYIGKLRRLTSEMRRQTGIDEILRAEGLSGGINELRNMVRGTSNARRYGSDPDPYEQPIEHDRSREYPDEGPDAYGAIPEDLLDEGAQDAAEPDAPAEPGAKVAHGEAPESSTSSKATA